MTSSEAKRWQPKAREMLQLHGVGISDEHIAALFEAPVEIVKTLVSSELAELDKEALNHVD